MKGVLKAIYAEPVVFLATIQAAATALSATDVIADWIPLVTLAVVVAIQRSLVTPSKSV